MRRPRPHRSRPRRGVALMDVMIGGVMLGIGLSVVMSVTSRSLARHTDGEKRLAASWLADELLNMVLVEGPIKYPKLYDTDGKFDPPFDDFGFSLDFNDLGLGEPMEVTATIRWPYRRPVNEITVGTLVAIPQGDENQLREPLEPVDRDARYFDEDFGGL